METQIKILIDSDYRELEKKVNEWLSNNCYYNSYKIIDIKYHPIVTENFYSIHCFISYIVN